jgi:V8-like Glu-specific endopeptidase
MQNMTLSGNAIDLLAPKITSALNTDAELDRIVHASTGDRLYDKYVGRGLPLEATVVQLLNVLDQNGTADIFLAYMCQRKPGRRDLRSAVLTLVPSVKDLDSLPRHQIDISAQFGGAVQEDAPSNALAPGFEKNLRPLIPTLDIHLWITELLKVERQICRIEENDQPLGTGFLVGEDLVLTNWHVVAGDAGKCRKGLHCRFDYKRLEDRVGLGKTVAILPDGCLAFSDYAATGDASSQSSDLLDFALLKLGESVGLDEQEQQRRGWVAVPAEASRPARDEPLIIVQHPLGQPMKIALDTSSVIGLNPSGNRLQYKTNTEPGSSGSPCFTIDWKLIAIHGASATAKGGGDVNQGTPIDLVAASIRKQRAEVQL